MPDILRKQLLLNLNPCNWLKQHSIHIEPNKTCQLSRLDPSDQDTEWPASFCPKTQRKCENTSDLVFINQVKAKVPLIVDAFIRVILTCIINLDTCTCKTKNNLGTWREMDIITPLNVPMFMWGRCCRSKYFCWVKIFLFLNQVIFRWHLISAYLYNVSHINSVSINSWFKNLSWI